jgi:hypothetical protein
VSADLDGLLREYALATESQGDTWSPIEEMRREQAANDTARRIADLLAAQQPVAPVLILAAA